MVLKMLKAAYCKHGLRQRGLKQSVEIHALPKKGAEGVSIGTVQTTFAEPRLGTLSYIRSDVLPRLPLDESERFLSQLAEYPVRGLVVDKQVEVSRRGCREHSAGTSRTLGEMK